MIAKKKSECIATTQKWKMFWIPDIFQRKNRIKTEESIKTEKRKQARKHINKQFCFIYYIYIIRRLSRRWFVCAYLGLRLCMFRLVGLKSWNFGLMRVKALFQKAPTLRPTWNPLRCSPSACDYEVPQELADLGLRELERADDLAQTTRDRSLVDLGLGLIPSQLRDGFCRCKQCFLCSRLRSWWFLWCLGLVGLPLGWWNLLLPSRLCRLAAASVMGELTRKHQA